MPTQSEIHASIRKKFSNLAQSLSLVTQYDNLPLASGVSPTEEKVWVKLAIIPGENDQKTIGDSTKVFRHTGVFIASIFAAFESGEKPIYDLVEEITHEFRSSSVDGVTYRTPSVVRVGRNDKWWQVNVTCPWFSDEIV